jgi:hypothetical protein
MYVLSTAEAVQKFPLPIDLHFHTPRTVVAELAVELTAVLPTAGVARS